MRAKHGERRDAHGGTHEERKAAEGDAVIGELGIKIKRKKGRQNKGSCDADMAGQDRGMPVMFEFLGIDAESDQEHEYHYAHLTQRVQKPQAVGRKQIRPDARGQPSQQRRT